MLGHMGLGEARMGLFGRTVFAALMVACLPAPLLAQKEQTKATAQEFLRVTTSNPALPSTFFDENIRNERSTMSVVGIIGDDECQSKMVIGRDYEYYNGFGWTRQKDSYDSSIDWRSIVSVTRAGSTITLLWTDSLKMRITYPAEDRATRAAFAMEFLRTQCDPTADLAF